MGQPEKRIAAYRVECEAVVYIDVKNPPDVIERVTGPNGDEWRQQFYPLRTAGDVSLRPVLAGRKGANKDLPAVTRYEIVHTWNPQKPCKWGNTCPRQESNLRSVYA